MDGAVSNWLQEIIAVLPEGGLYLCVLLLIALFESLPMIGLALPGSTLVILAGFLAAHGKGTLLPLILATTLGALLGDLLSYWLGARFGSPLLKRKTFKKHRNLINRAELFFAAHGGKSIFFARFLGPIRGITPFIAGLARMPGKAFVRYALISAILWGIAYPGVGYLGGASWQQAQSLTTRFGLLILLALVVTILHFWLRRSLHLNPGEKKHGN
jgi:undecaprenyl-diphosphatase